MKKLYQPTTLTQFESPMTSSNMHYTPFLDLTTTFVSDFIPGSMDFFAVPNFKKVKVSMAVYLGDLTAGMAATAMECYVIPFVYAIPSGVSIPARGHGTASSYKNIHEFLDAILNCSISELYFFPGFHMQWEPLNYNPSDSNRPINFKKKMLTLDFTKIARKINAEFVGRETNSAYRTWVFAFLALNGSAATVCVCTYPFFEIEYEFNTQSQGFGANIGSIPSVRSQQMPRIRTGPGYVASLIADYSRLKRK